MERVFLFLSPLSDKVPSWFLWGAVGVMGAVGLGTAILLFCLSRSSRKETGTETEERL